MPASLPVGYSLSPSRCCAHGLTLTPTTQALPTVHALVMPQMAARIRVRPLHTQGKACAAISAAASQLTATLLLCSCLFSPESQPKTFQTTAKMGPGCCTPRAGPVLLSLQLPASLPRCCCAHA